MTEEEDESAAYLFRLCGKEEAEFIAIDGEEERVYYQYDGAMKNMIVWLKSLCSQTILTWKWKKRCNFGRERKKTEKRYGVIPVGGLDQRIGQNMTLIECEDQILVVDCGVAFPGSDMLGIDLIIPNFDYLRENREKVVGVVLTHGHEDDIGALPYFLREFQVPVSRYGADLGAGREQDAGKQCQKVQLNCG